LVLVFELALDLHEFFVVLLGLQTHAPPVLAHAQASVVVGLFVQLGNHLSRLDHVVGLVQFVRVARQMLYKLGFAFVVLDVHLRPKVVLACLNELFDRQVLLGLLGVSLVLDHVAARPVIDCVEDALDLERVAHPEFRPNLFFLRPFTHLPIAVLGLSRLAIQ